MQFSLLNRAFVQNLILYIAFFGLLAWNVAIYVQSPTQSDWIFIKEANQLGQDANMVVISDWTYDYWYETYSNEKLWYDAQTEKRWDVTDRPFIALTSADLNCELVKEEGETTRTRKAIYKCT